MLLNEAREIAERVCDLLRPACAEIAIAGSIRREKPEVKDIEIVCRPLPRMNLFGEPHLSYDTEQRRDGERYKRLWWAGWNPSAGIAIDLFIADDANFGNQLAIRTGDADFSRLLFTQRVHGGLLPSHLQQRDGYLWLESADGGFNHRYRCEDEATFFLVLTGFEDVPDPRLRNAAYIERMRKWYGL